jgi:hypothetical protein
VVQPDQREAQVIAAQQVQQEGQVNLVQQDQRVPPVRQANVVQLDQQVEQVIVAQPAQLAQLVRQDKMVRQDLLEPQVK